MIVDREVVETVVVVVLGRSVVEVVVTDVDDRRTVVDGAGTVVDAALGGAVVAGAGMAGT